MIDPNFDPLQMMQEIYDNQVILNQNQTKQSQALHLMAQRINEQQQTINHLVQGLEACNRANISMLTTLDQNLQNLLKEKQHG